MHRRIAIVLALASSVFASPARAEDTAVDVELVLAVDASWSMDFSEQRLQREGYVAAFRSPEVRAAILGGGYQKVAVTYVEWAGEFSQTVVVPWTLIDSDAAAAAFADRLAAAEPERARRTSIAAAIDFAAPLFEGNGFAGQRRVIDVSGDGPNNQGRTVTQSRDAAAARGITINGLPLMTSGRSEGYGSWGSIPHLDRYYAACVIGGPGAFMIPVNDWGQFPEAVRRKLVLELAGRTPPETLVDAPTLRIQYAAEQPDCLVGERLWRDRQNGGSNDR